MPAYVFGGKAGGAVYLAPGRSSCGRTEGEMLASSDHRHEMGHAELGDGSDSAGPTAQLNAGFVHGLSANWISWLPVVQGTHCDRSVTWGRRVTLRPPRYAKVLTARAAEAIIMLQSMEAGCAKPRAIWRHNADDCGQSPLRKLVNEHAQQGYQACKQIRQELSC